MITIGALFMMMALLPALLILHHRLQALNRQLQNAQRTGQQDRLMTTQAITVSRQRWAIVDPERIEVRK